MGAYNVKNRIARTVYFKENPIYSLTPLAGGVGWTAWHRDVGRWWVDCDGPWFGGGDVGCGSRKKLFHRNVVHVHRNVVHQHADRILVLCYCYAVHVCVCIVMVNLGIRMDTSPPVCALFS